jgi:hypothetical protein
MDNELNSRTDMKRWVMEMKAEEFMVPKCKTSVSIRLYITK